MLGKYYFCPAGLEIGLGYGLAGLEPPARARNSQKKPQIIFNNPRSSIKPESAPDPIIYL